MRREVVRSFRRLFLPCVRTIYASFFLFTACFDRRLQQITNENLITFIIGVFAKYKFTSIEKNPTNHQMRSLSQRKSPARGCGRGACLQKSTKALTRALLISKANYDLFQTYTARYAQSNMVHLFLSILPCSMVYCGQSLQRLENRHARSSLSGQRITGTGVAF